MSNLLLGENSCAVLGAYGLAGGSAVGASAALDHLAKPLGVAVCSTLALASIVFLALGICALICGQQSSGYKMSQNRYWRNIPTVLIGGGTGAFTAAYIGTNNGMAAAFFIIGVILLAASIWPKAAIEALALASGWSYGYPPVSAIDWFEEARRLRTQSPAEQEAAIRRRLKTDLHEDLVEIARDAAERCWSEQAPETRQEDPDSNPTEGETS